MGPSRLSIAVAAAAALALSPAAAGASAATAGVATSTVAKSSRPEARYGERGQITATVKALKLGSGTPTGEVEFTVDGGYVGNVPLVSGKAALPLEWIYNGYSPGPHSVVANYLGEGVFEASSSAPVTQTLIGRTSEATSTITLDEKGRPTFSPNRFSLRFQEPFSCNVGIHNETPNAYQVLYGTPGTWKALKYVIPAGGYGGFGAGMEGTTAYFTVRGAANYVAIRCT